jgi:formylglycine-generating enzyme required for sulfatase activity
MSDEEKSMETNVQATDNSTAVGNLQVGGSVGGSINIGTTTNIYNYGTGEDLKSLFTSVTIKIEEGIEPETILILEGKFWLGSNSGDGIKEYDIPRHQVLLPVYRIGKTPVTNAQYYQFVSQTDRSVKPVIGWGGRKIPKGRENEPVRGVTWDDIQGYCQWLSALTKRKYEVPNEAQLEKAYQGSYGCIDLVDNIYLWTCTLWGEDPDIPEYRYPWTKDLARNNPNANNSIRRVVCRYQKLADADAYRRHSRTGQLVSEAGLSGARHSFRVVMNE